MNSIKPTKLRSDTATQKDTQRLEGQRSPPMLKQLKEAAYARDNKKNGKDWRRGVGWALAKMAEGIMGLRERTVTMRDTGSVDGDKFDRGWYNGLNDLVNTDIPTNEQLDELLKG